MNRAKLMPVHTSLPPVPPPGDNGHRTARRAVDLLCQQDGRFRIPSRAERAALMVAFAHRQQSLHAAAFDAIWSAEALDLSDPGRLLARLDEIKICEIKSTNQAKLGEDLKGYFFNITSAELLTAQSLGANYRFIFVNTTSGQYQEMSLSEVMARARAMYPAWHIRF